MSTGMTYHHVNYTIAECKQVMRWDIMASYHSDDIIITADGFVIRQPDPLLLLANCYGNREKKRNNGKLRIKDWTDDPKWGHESRRPDPFQKKER